MRLIFLCAVTFLVMTNVAFAAPAMRSHVCEITAVVEKIEKREEVYEPESWRESWGLPESFIYTDVTLFVHTALKLEEHEEGGCAPEDLPKVFQFRERSATDLSAEPELERCIRAKTQFSGDEFSIGQWLYDVELVSDGVCDH